MTKFNYKLFFFTAVLVLFCFKSFSDDTEVKSNFITIGSNEAKVEIKIYSSLTCPHCANFHINIIPDIIKNYVDSGKVKIIFFDFPLDQAAFNASKLVNCFENDKNLMLLDVLYEKQNEWTSGANIDEIDDKLKKIVKNLGINSLQFDGCLINEVIADKILNERIDAHKKYSISSTPTIIINEKKFEDSVSFENIQKKIEKLI
jgi:protein-disulfide isomerase